MHLGRSRHAFGRGRRCDRNAPASVTRTGERRAGLKGDKRVPGARSLTSVLEDSHQAGRCAAEETGAIPGDEAAPTAMDEDEAAPV